MLKLQEIFNNGGSYRAGYICAYSSDNICNPYLKFTPKWFAWRRGFRHALERLLGEIR